MHRIASGLALLGLLAAACNRGSTGFPRSAFGPGAGTDAAGTGSTGSTGSTGADAPSAGTGGSGSTGAQPSAFRFDVPMPDAGAAAHTCPAVDLLFVIDDSGSMSDEQANLVDSFPGFVSGIEDLLGPAATYHVGVVTTDDYAFNAAGCQRIGALTTRTGGDLSSDAVCGPFAAGGGYMTADDDFAAAFACAAHVGIDGDGVHERPMDALASTLEGTDPGVADCDAGFLRDEALLVIVVITDEEDEGDSQGDPPDWYENVVAAKGGDADHIVVLSLIGHPKPNDCLPTQWTGMQGAEISPRLIAFTEMFDHGVVGDVCSPSYVAAFNQTVEGIADACGIPTG